MRLGHFELLEYIGGGGMGRVFRARDTSLDRMVAVKVLSRDQAADLETLARFRNEAQSAARLNHENIARVFHVGEEEGLPYIVFEFIEGANIRVLVERQGPLPLAEAVTYTFQIAESLAHAARVHVVHRDIKPSNVLVTEEGRAKLIDMGLARIQRLGDAEADLTASGVTLGTFDYISPEQARDPRTADVRSDIYSLGCTFFFMLAGRPPFPEGTVLQKLLQHQGEEPPDVREFRPELPEQVSRLLHRMMAKDPRRRFQTPEELIEGLAQLAEDVGLYPIDPAERAWSQPRRSRFLALQAHLPWIAPIAVLIAMVLLLDRLTWSTEDLRSLAANTVEPSSVEPGKIVPPEEEDPLAPLWQLLETVAANSETDPAKQGTVPGGATEGAASKAEGKTAAAAKAASGGTSSKEQAGNTAAAKPPEKVVESSGAKPATGASSNGASNSASSVASKPGVKPTTPATPREPRLPAAGVLVVDGIGDLEGSNIFATLEQAVSRATSGDVIELRFDGPNLVTPLSLSNLKLTIRAAEQSKPVLLFQPAEKDPLKYRRSMFTLDGSQLTLIRVGVELNVPDQMLADRWSLFEIRQSRETRLEQCVLTIRNATDSASMYPQEAAFFRVLSPSGDTIVKGPPTADLGGSVPLPPDPISIVLQDCIARGEATFVRAYDLRPFELTWKNGLLVTTERLLVAEGGERAALPADAYRINLHHLTAIVRGGLCRFSQSDFAPRQLPAVLNCANSIFASTGGAIIEQTGVAPIEDFRERIDWTGEQNFYEGFSAYWKVQYNDSELMPEPEIWDSTAWRSYWDALQREIRPSANRVVWKQLPSGDRPVSSHLPGDYALDAAAIPQNPAIGTASDGGDAGMRIEPLPLPSAPPTAIEDVPADPVDLELDSALSD